jgi:hypothetical protein
MQMEMPFLPSSFPAFLLSAFAFLLFAVSLFPNAQQPNNHRRQHTAELRATKGQVKILERNKCFLQIERVKVN